MSTLPTRLRGPLLGLLLAALVAVPNARADDAEKQKQIQQIEKQLAELQKRLAELKAAPAPARTTTPAGTIPDSILKQYQWRCIGPANMGGRITAIAVVEADPATYFIATASGGLLKTINNGTTFEHLFDQQATVSIGDVAVSQSNPKVVWVGTGENNPRNSVSYGDGVYKSTDGGKTWANVGLKQTFQIGKVVIHPKNPDIVYVGALGRLYGPNAERGVFKTTDGGKTWTKVLYVDDKTGCIDLKMDPADPNTLVAAMWEHRRDEFDGFFANDKDAPRDRYGPVVTYGAGGGLYKTSDAGGTWKKLKDGLPGAKTGRIGLDYSRKTKGLLVAIIDTEKGGTGPETKVYMGIIGEDADHAAKLTEITADSPAARAGLKPNDLVTAIDGAKVTSYDSLVDHYQGKNPGETVKLTVKRGDKSVPVAVKLGKRGENPQPRGAVLPPVTGVQFARGARLTVESVLKDGPAAKAGVKAGDVVTAINGKGVKTIQEYSGALTGKEPGDAVKLTLTRGKQTKTVEVVLAPNPRAAQAEVRTVLMPGFVPTIGRREEPVKVASVPAGGPAAKAGVKAGDVVSAINGEKVSNLREMMRQLRVGPRVEDPRKAGDKVKVAFQQPGGRSKVVELALVETVVPGLGGRGQRNAPPGLPYAMGLGGQRPNVTIRQGKDGHQTGGIYLSKDNGETWARVNSLNPRPMYFSVVRIDPTDDDTLYVTADTPTPLYRSTDGGKTFSSLTTARGVHADAHALWIDPKDSRHVIIGCDGGFYVSYDKCATWEHLNHLALGQFYHVAADTKRPYHVYGGLQDNGSWGGPSRTLRSYGPVTEDWVIVGGGDGFVCRVDSTDPDLVYSESQGGVISRRNLRTGDRAGVRPRRGQNDAPLRFNWNTPFILSHHNPSIFYCGAQFVFRSLNKGSDLKQISPELTRTKKGSLTALAESPRNADVLWAGSDDGYLWVSKDGGANWTNVSAHLASAGLPGPRWVASVEPSRDKDGRAYVVLDAHRSNDDRPYVCVTDDYGQTWKSLNANLPEFGSTRVLREDAVNTNVLYLGTEFGAWVSANKGASWSKLGGNLPTVAVHEFAQPTTANELVAATHGRSLWVLDVTSLRQMKPETLKAAATLFAPSPGVRWLAAPSARSPYSSAERAYVGQNPPAGTAIEYLLTRKTDKVSLKVVDVTGKTIWSARNPSTDAGLHRVQWNLSGAARRAAGGRQVAGPQVPPGTYQVVLTVGDKEYTQPVKVELDPNAPRDLVATDDYSQPEEDEEEREREEAEKLPKTKRGGGDD